LGYHENMEIGRNPQQQNPNSGENSLSSNMLEQASIIFGVNKKRVKIKKGNVKKVAKGMAEVAYSLGETNEPEEYAAEMADEIMLALKELENRQSDKKVKPKPSDS